MTPRLRAPSWLSGPRARSTAAYTAADTTTALNQFSPKIGMRKMGEKGVPESELGYLGGEDSVPVYKWKNLRMTFLARQRIVTGLSRKPRRKEKMQARLEHEIVLKVCKRCRALI